MAVIVLALVFAGAILALVVFVAVVVGVRVGRLADVDA